MARSDSTSEATTAPTTNSTEPGGPAGVRSVVRALDVLALVGENPAGFHLRAAVEATQLPKTTVLRLLQTLERQGFLWNVGNQTYVAGPALLHLGMAAVDAWRLPPELSAAMDDLAHTTQETVNLWIRRGIKRLCVAQAQPARALRHVVRVGDELNMDVGAAPRVLLCGAPDRVLTDVAAASDHGPDHVMTLRRWVEETNASGFTVSHGEFEEGLSAIAVPVRTRRGEVIAALALSGVTVRYTDDRVDGLIEALRRTADSFAGAGFGSSHGIGNTAPAGSRSAP